MWTRTFAKTYAGITAEQVWTVWAEVDAWPAWQDDLERAHCEGGFAAGQRIVFHPKGGPDLSLELTEVVPGRRFTDRTRFSLARMDDIHELKSRPEGVEVRSTIRVEGLLAFLWVRLVARGIVDGLERQTDALVRRARTRHDGPEAPALFRRDLDVGTDRT
jgi:hypothetical protein